MEKNKTGKYLKYAIGEIILVVIGILIAIWINGSYNDYKEKKAERIILNNILVDIESDYKQLKDIESFYNKNLANIKKAKSAFFKNQNDSLAIYIKQRYAGAMVKDINPRTTTYDEIINSGKLYNLSNENLTDTFIDYYEMLENNTYQVRQNRTEYRNLHFGPQMNEYWLLYLDIKENSENVPELIKSFVDNKNSLAYKTLKQTTGYGEELIEGALSFLKRIEQANRNLKSELETELKIKK